MVGDTTPIAILRRMIEVGGGGLSVPLAEAILQIHFDDRDQGRVSELAGKANRGSLTDDEATEYDAYLAAADFLSVWKAKARASLKTSPTAA